jgi:hypothetical protein
MFAVSFDTRGVSRAATLLDRSLNQPMTDALQRAGNDVLVSIRGGEHWRVRTGKTGQSFRMTASGAWAYRISSPSKIAHFLDVGTKSHVIQARRRPVLRFFWERKGAWFAGKRVNHPGTKPRRYLHVEAARLETYLLPRYFGENLRRVVSASGWS